MSSIKLLLTVFLVCILTIHALPTLKPTQWLQKEATPRHIQIDLTIALRQQHTDELNQILKDVSDPQSWAYGQHWSNEEINKFVAPTQYSIHKVKNWLMQNKIDLTNLRSSPNEDFLTITMSVDDAERLLNTKYYSYQHISNTDTIIHRVEEYSLPAEIDAHIDIIGPTTRFPHHASKQVKSNLKSKQSESVNADNPCASGVTPSCLNTLYNIQGYSAKNPNSSVAVTGYLEEYISLTDLNMFFQNFDPTSMGRVPNIVGPNDETNPGVEASLDIQFVMGVGHGLNTTFWYTAGRQPNNTENEPFLVFLQDLASDNSAPWVVSTSYGDDYNTVDYDYAVRVNTEFMKAGARGISLLFSSGDSGVGDGNCNTFVPTFPATSPYVTSVGASMSYPEVAASFSSGGFSNYFEIPDYQQQAVSNYFNKYGSNFPSSKLYNTSGRGFPDISCQGVDFEIVVAGQVQFVDGTSCSAPTCSAMIALLNDARFQNGKKSLGFLNYWLYSNVTMFNDVTQGNNPGCNSNGFYAAVQWDPVTGLGTPNFDLWRSIVTNL